jgi:hypothetical protein
MEAKKEMRTEIVLNRKKQQQQLHDDDDDDGGKKRVEFGEQSQRGEARGEKEKIHAKAIAACLCFCSRSAFFLLLQLDNKITPNTAPLLSLHLSRQIRLFKYLGRIIPTRVWRVLFSRVEF